MQQLPRIKRVREHSIDAAHAQRIATDPFSSRRAHAQPVCGDLEQLRYRIAARQQQFPQVFEEVESGRVGDKLSIFVVDRAGDSVAQLHLGSIYECYGKAKSGAEELQRARIDLAGGESDTVEFKPFLAQKDVKELEFVKTVIAFANTYGGRILGIPVKVNIDSGGKPNGVPERR